MGRNARRRPQQPSGSPDGAPEADSATDKSRFGSTHVNVQQSHRPTHTDNRADVPKSKVPSLVLQVCEDLIAPMAVVRYMECYPPK